MKNFLFHRIICLILTSFVIAQVGYSTDLEKQYELALNYKNTAQADSSVIIFNQIIKTLNNQQAINTELGLSVRLHLLDMKVDTVTDAIPIIQTIHQIIDAATVQENWKIVAEAKIIIALLYQKTRQYSDCLQYLNQTILLIEKHQIQELYAKYAVRRASYLRRGSGHIDSIEYYANEALTYALEQDNKTKAEAYFNLARVKRFSSNKAAIHNYKKAAILYQKLGNGTQEVAMLVYVAEAFNAMNQLDSANFYNDLAKRDFNKVTLPVLSSIYYNKAKIYQQVENLDSAWYFLKLSYEAQLQRMIQENRNVMTEVEERYQTQKKSEQIEQQQEALQAEKTLRNRTNLIAVALFALITLLTYFYLQLRKANRINRQQAERLKNLDQAKSRFFANVSHELRTPLTLMTAPINTLLKENHLTTKQSTLLQTAANSGQQLKQLINEILDLRKLELDKLTVEVEPTVLHTFFLRYVAQFDSLAERKKINFSYHLNIGEAIVADIDREKCRQILYNLLSNAFKFTPDGGRIALDFSYANQKLFLKVSDTGRGIHPDDIPYIFDRYFQTNRPDKPIEGGTGIGLALCKEYAELLGGSIEIESTLHEGTTFILSFPLLLSKNQDLVDKEEVQINTALSSYRSLDKNAKITSNSTKGKARILVVEDNPALSNYLQLLLSEQYEVVTSEHGQQAWEILFAGEEDKFINDFQLIISDLMMPVMDGYQLLEKLKSHDATRHIPVIMLTARAELRDKMKALRIGVDDYLTKPFEEEELLVRIENLLSHQASRSLPMDTSKEQEKAIPIISAEDQKWLSKFEHFVQKNLSNPSLSIPILADHFLVSEPTLFRQMKRTTGLSPAQYLKEVRLAKALQLLENHTYNSISKVAYEVGYSDPNSFRRAFKRRFGKSPSKIINN